MLIRKAIGVLVLAVACAAAPVGAAHATPAPESSVAQSITAASGVSADGRSVTSALIGGTFRTAAAGVDVLDRAGAVQATIPLTYSVAGATYRLDPVIGADGTTLRLTPEPFVPVSTVATQVVTKDQAWRNVLNQGQKGWAYGGQQFATWGALIGAGIGCVVIPVLGCLPGPIIGYLVGGYIGISTFNPDFQPAVDLWMRTP